MFVQQMREVRRRLEFIQGVTSWAWGFRPKWFRLMRPTRDRVAHSQPGGCESWSRVVVSALIYIYILHTYHTYHAQRSRFHLISYVYTKILQGVRSEKPRVSHYPQVLRTFVPKVKAATAKLACFNGVSHHPPVSLEFRPEIQL